MLTRGRGTLCWAAEVHGHQDAAWQSQNCSTDSHTAPALLVSAGNVSGAILYPTTHACPHMASVMNVQRRVTRMAKIRTDKKTLAVQLKKKEKEDAHRPPNTQMIALKKESASDLFNSTGEKKR